MGHFVVLYPVCDITLYTRAGEGAYYIQSVTLLYTRAGEGTYCIQSVTLLSTQGQEKEHIVSSQ